MHAIVIAAALAVTACADGSDASVGDCTTAPECLGSTDGDSFCHGYVQRVCSDDGNGCLALVEDDCSKSSARCDDSSGDATCVTCNDVVCEGATEGRQVCGGDNVMQCNADVDGCLLATIVQDCADSGLVCADAGAGPICRASCDDSACVGKNEGDGICSGQVLSTCRRDTQGCLKSVQVDCTTTGATCDASGAQPACVGGCPHHPLCDGSSDGDTLCNGYSIVYCTDTDADGCLEASETTHCSENLCDAASSPLICEATAPSGNVCAEAIPVAQSGLRVTSALTRFSDNQTFTGSDCIVTSAQPEFVLTVALKQGDVLQLVAGTGGNLTNVTMSVQQTTCDATAACLASVAASSLWFIAPTTDTYYAVVEAVPAGAGATSVDVSAYINPICGNGFLDPGESCDDANETSSDGCSASCTVEGGFACSPLAPTLCIPIP